MSALGVKLSASPASTEVTESAATDQTSGLKRSQRASICLRMSNSSGITTRLQMVMARKSLR
jgi:hypothetical protein